MSLMLYTIYYTNVIFLCIWGIDTLVGISYIPTGANLTTWQERNYHEYSIVLCILLIICDTQNNKIVYFNI